MKKLRRIIEFDAPPEPEPESDPPPQLAGPFERMPSWPPTPPETPDSWRPPLESIPYRTGNTSYEPRSWVRYAGKPLVCIWGGTSSGSSIGTIVGCGIFPEIIIIDGTARWLCACNECMRVRSSIGRAPAF